MSIEVITRFGTNNKDNFIDFILDMKISVPKQSIQQQMKKGTTSIY